MSSGAENGWDGVVPAVADTASFTLTQRNLADAAGFMGRALDALTEAEAAVQRAAARRDSPAVTAGLRRRADRLTGGIAAARQAIDEALQEGPHGTEQ